MQKKICDLDIKDGDRETLNYLFKPRRIGEVAAKNGVAYTTACQKLAIWRAMGLIHRLKTASGVRYVINEAKVKP